MKILVMGCGHLGSEVAMQALIHLKPTKLMLYDIKKLEGDMLDLQHACKGLGLSTEITDKLEPADFIIMCAGKPRHKEDDDLYQVNADIVLISLHKARAALTRNTKIIMLSNPVLELTELLMTYHANPVYNPEEILKEMRGGKELGWQIIKSGKGYSSLGPSVACIRLIKQLEKETSN
jgi:malate/lactate dehydrogenase